MKTAIFKVFGFAVVMIIAQGCVAYAPPPRIAAYPAPYYGPAYYGPAYYGPSFGMSFGHGGGWGGGGGHWGGGGWGGGGHWGGGFRH